MPKRYCKYIFILFSFLLYCSLGFCGVGIPTDRLISGTSCSASQVEKFEFTMTKFEISYDSGTTWTTVWEGTQTFDLASASGTDSLAATIFSNMPVTAGTINRLRVTIGRNCTVRGYVTYSGVTYKTTAGTNQAAGTGTTGAGDATTYDSTMAETDVYTQEEAREMVINEGQTKRLKMTFNLADALGLMSAGPDSYSIVPKYVSPDVSEE